MIGFSRSESQGLVWAEAWSMDVSTFLWRHDSNEIGGKIVKTSTAPYLTEQNGRFFGDIEEGDIEEFERILTEWEVNQNKYCPRQWVLENISDEACARKLCMLAGIALK